MIFSSPLINDYYLVGQIGKIAPIDMVILISQIIFKGKSGMWESCVYPLRMALFPVGRFFWFPSSKLLLIVTREIPRNKTGTKKRLNRYIRLPD